MIKNFKVLDTFKLFGKDWNVEWDNKRLNDKENYGECFYGQNKITLSQTQGLDDLSLDKINQTFVHELIHAILDSMHEHDISKDERFVNTFSELLYQYFKTAK